MSHLKTLAAAILCASLLPLSSAFAQTMNKADYQAGKTRISADYKTDKMACNSMKGNAKDICQEEAKAKALKAEVVANEKRIAAAAEAAKVEEVVEETAEVVADAETPAVEEAPAAEEASEETEA